MTDLVDKFGRKVNYLRISVTDRCDFRCVYCMAEEMTFLPRRQILSLEEIERIAAVFVSLGVRKIRLTGGEPLIRRNVLDLVGRMGQMPDLDQLVLTTNGSQLPHMAASLKQSGVRRINVSLDSLDPDRFRSLTRTGDLNQVLSGIDAALQQDFDSVKINAVILKGRNDDEILPLVDFARTRGTDITFIEEMPLGNISEHQRDECFMPSEDVRAVIQTQYPLNPTTLNSGGPARYYQFEDSKTRVGFISPHSHNFCGDCNRVRLTAEGRLLLCLGNEHSVDLREVVRSTEDNQVLRQVIVDAMGIKPDRHYFDLQDEPQIVRFMNMTGG
ncbi:MAG: GTP 3',8-cyclase MoaA [Alcanivorax sp.]|jgi:GTP 3',8-cyclase|uniref:GTP 3',8-cyclase MoaA n=1 Tax=unclassified Ketobacter TaxID=2639109 RepID=UPI000F15E6B6|nr:MULTISPECIES: GTP 3',8-cyclase MoaA [unclassified Ketobacter]MEC8813673.1 GTP 3',8-cyclase MoaA [Pseudomonadota bacterium]RLT88489.1 MAG: GTP 3',8-cyclase MoaA [Ketobacter sp. GenoA1]RLT95437.1 MAG: GTP 3',8-cyclase MoaA [Ketobacter sp.]TNC83772.1 MAG: GTP 3',8-cyclase MoaA [Alcanivorax sp.]